MVLRLKAWESRSPPGLPSARPAPGGRMFLSRSGSSTDDAGWSSLVARQAHNLKVAGSNPAPATTLSLLFQQDGGGILFGCGVWNLPRHRIGTISFPRCAQPYAANVCPRLRSLSGLPNTLEPASASVSSPLPRDRTYGQRGGNDPYHESSDAAPPPEIGQRPEDTRAIAVESRSSLLPPWKGGNQGPRWGPLLMAEQGGWSRHLLSSPPWKGGGRVGG